MPFAGIIGFGHDTRAHLLDEEHMRVQEEFVVNNGGDDEIRQSPYECDSVCNPRRGREDDVEFYSANDTAQGGDKLYPHNC